MLEHYFIKPGTIDRIRNSWLGEPIERYVTWLHEQGYASRNVFRRVPILMHFGEFTRNEGAHTWEDLPFYVDRFVNKWVQERGINCKNERARKSVDNEARNPVQQLLCLVISDYQGAGRSRARTPFLEYAPGFFLYLQEEKGLRRSSIAHYQHYLRLFQKYLTKIELHNLDELSPIILSAFIIDKSHSLSQSSMGGLCGTLRVFLRYLYREQRISKDLSLHVAQPQKYALCDIPRSISWNDVRRMLEVVDRRLPVGKRDYAILLLLITYGLRSQEVASLTLDNIDWKRERLFIPGRKAGHSTAYPLSPLVGEAILAYLQQVRSSIPNRHVFCRVLAPHSPLTHGSVSSRVSYYLHKAGIQVARAGSHTLRHTCVQRLIEAEIPFKTIGDYVGHRSPSSTQIYTKVSIEALRKVALGDGEDIL